MLRLLLAAVCALVWMTADGRDASAQTWPERPITLIHGFGAGGNADSISRLVATALSEQLGVAVIVDTRPGAGGNIASDMVARAEPDGATITLLTGGHAVSAALYKKLKFDPVGSFAFVSLIGTFPFVIATRVDSPLTDLASLIATAKAQPGKQTFSSVGFGSTQHLTGELLSMSADIKLTHVPYRGGMQPLTDVLGGQIDLIVDTITVTGPAIKAGTLRGLGVSSAEPWPALPGIAPIAGQLPGFDVRSWIGIAAPANTPPDVIARLNEALRTTIASSAFRERLDLLGVRARASSPAEMHDFVAAEIKRWAGVIEKAGVQRIE